MTKTVTSVTSTRKCTACGARRGSSKEKKAMMGSERTAVMARFAIQES